MTLICLADFNRIGITAKTGDVRYFAADVATRLLNSYPKFWEDKPELEGVTWAGWTLP